MHRIPTPEHCWPVVYITGGRSPYKAHVVKYQRVWRAWRPGSLVVVEFDTWREAIDWAVGGRR